MGSLIFDGLIQGGALYTGGGLIHGRSFVLISVIVLNKYSNSDKQVSSIVIIVINNLIVVIIVINNNDKQVGLYSDGLILRGGLIFGMR